MDINEINSLFGTPLSETAIACQMNNAKENYLIYGLLLGVVLLGGYNYIKTTNAKLNTLNHSRNFYQ
jgi:hypothetical protein